MSCPECKANEERGDYYTKRVNELQAELAIADAEKFVAEKRLQSLIDILSELSDKLSSEGARDISDIGYATAMNLANIDLMKILNGVEYGSLDE